MADELLCWNAPAKRTDSSEARILREILLALSELKTASGDRACVVWRQHVGTFMGPSGYPVKIGVKGMSDIGGVLKDGRLIQIEAKTSTGRIRPEQITWGQMVRAFGGLFFVARSAESAVIAVREALGE